MGKKIICGIYKIVCVKNGRYYYGSSENIPRRWEKEHLPALRRGNHFNSIVQRVYDKYGESSFRLECIENVIDKKKLFEVEDIYLDKYFDDPKCMNISKQASVGKPGIPAWNRGIPRSEECKRKMSETRRRRKITPWNKGKPWSPEMRKVISDSLIGRKFSIEEQDKRSKRDYPLIIDPEGNEHIITNVARFCREHGLNRYGLWATINGRQNSCYGGWKVKVE